LRHLSAGITITANGNTQETVMETSITSKGQTTIPKRIRDYLGVGPGSRVEFALAADGRVVVRKAGRKAKPKRDRLEALRRIPTLGLGTEEVMRMTRGDDWSEKSQRRRRAA
jgi:AbrB family looped-hinge helix DNA binding protein